MPEKRTNNALRKIQGKMSQQYSMPFFKNKIQFSKALTTKGVFLVDGKKKPIQVLKANHLGKPDPCQKICERMVL